MDRAYRASSCSLFVTPFRTQIIKTGLANASRQNTNHQHLTRYQAENVCEYRLYRPIDLERLRYSPQQSGLMETNDRQEHRRSGTYAYRARAWRALPRRVPIGLLDLCQRIGFATDRQACCCGQQGTSRQLHIHQSAHCADYRREFRQTSFATIRLCATHHSTTSTPRT